VVTSAAPSEKRCEKKKTTTRRTTRRTSRRRDIGRSVREALRVDEGSSATAWEVVTSAAPSEKRCEGPVLRPGCTDNDPSAPTILHATARVANPRSCVQNKKPYSVGAFFRPRSIASSPQKTRT